jgi:L-fuconolactonase
MPRTDTHAHIYSDDLQRYPMIAQPFRPASGLGTVGHLRLDMAASGVKRVVAVQATTAYGWDNRFLVEAARDNAPWMVGVCTLDAENPASPALLRHYVTANNVRGLRSYAAPERDGHLDHPGVEALWATAEELGIVVCVRIHVEHADELEIMLRRHRALRVVLDHCMYPRAEQGRQSKTMRRVLQLAQHPNLYAKLTWLVESSAQDHPFADTYPLMRAVLAAYGPERCIWGSDFPCELWIPKATYVQHYTLFAQALGLSDAHKEIILSTVPGHLFFGEP